MFNSGKNLLRAAVVLGAWVASSSASAATINIVGCDALTTDASAGASSITITCGTPSAPPPPSATAPGNCSVTPSPTQLPATGGSVSLTANCTSGPAPTSTTWTRTRTGSFAASFSPPDTLPDNSASSAPAYYTYAARLCAGDPNVAANCTTASSSTVTVAAGVVAPPPSASSCGSSTVVTPVLETSGQATDFNFTGDRFLASGGFNGTAVAVGKINVPSTAKLGGSAWLQVYEYAGVKTDRRMWLSKSRCNTAFTGTGYAAGKTPTIYIRVGGSPLTGEVLMQPGETWYVMVKNETALFGGAATSSCTTGDCPAAITLTTIK